MFVPPLGRSSGTLVAGWPRSMTFITLAVRRKCIDPFINRLQMDRSGKINEMDFNLFLTPSLLRNFPRSLYSIALFGKLHMVGLGSQQQQATSHNNIYFVAVMVSLDLCLSKPSSILSSDDTAPAVSLFHQKVVRVELSNFPVN